MGTGGAIFFFLAALLPVGLAGAAAPGGAPLELGFRGQAAAGRWILLEARRRPPLELSWSQEAGPAVSWEPEESQQPQLWVYLPRPGEYRFALRTRGEEGWSEPAVLELTAEGVAPPHDHPAAPAKAGLGEAINLPGEGWKQVDGPPAELVYAPESQATVFRPWRPGFYLFEALHAGEWPTQRGLRVPVGRDGRTADRRPQAELVLAGQCAPGQQIELDGTLSNDPDGDPLSAQWSSPDLGRGVELRSRPDLTARFVASRPGLFRVALIVSDGKLESHPAERLIEVVAQPARVEERQPARDALQRRCTLGLYNATLERALRLLPSRGGWALSVYAGAEEERLEERPLNLGFEEAPVKLALDWIARQTGTVYRLAGEQGLWLLPAGRCADNGPVETVVEAVDALYDRPDGSDLEALLRQPFRGLLKERPDVSLQIHPEGQRLVAVLPRKAAARLKDLMHALREPKGLGLPLPPSPSPEAWAFRRVLAERRITLSARNRRLDFLLRDLAQAAGISAACDPRGFPGYAAQPGAEGLKSLPRVSVEWRETPLREAARELAAAAACDGCQPHPLGGLWFYRGAEPYPSSENLWDHVYPRLYDLTILLERFKWLSGPAIAHQARRRVFPESWNDGATACEFHAPTGKLLVVHGEEAQARVLLLLYDLLQRGEWALGPEGGP